jgi:hypothetical protein
VVWLGEGLGQGEDRAFPRKACKERKGRQREEAEQLEVEVGGERVNRGQ